MKGCFWLLFLTLIAFYLAIPPFSITVPGYKQRVVLKPEVLQVNILNQKLILEDRFKYGLDLQGGTSLLFSLDTTKIKQSEVAEAAEVVRATVERRVNYFGVAEPEITLLKNQNQFRLAVDLPGQKNSQEAIRLIGKIAELDFREYSTKKVKQGTLSATVADFKKTKLTGKYLKKASLTFNQNTGSPEIALSFNSEGTKLFAQITSKNLKKPLAIFLDNQLLTAPMVQDEIKTGQAVISGQFTTQQAKEMILALNSGVLPVPIKPIEQKTLEATLGADNVQKSVFSGIVGLVCLMVFMVAIYGKYGLISLLSLGLYALYSLATYKTLGITLTLSGIAGFILSIGMAVDSNILIYERIKEEKNRGETESTAVEKGFKSALSAIKDANINTLIVCFVLFNPFNFSYLPTSGTVRGFVVTLALGVFMSLFTGVFVTKNILWRLYKIDSN